MSRLTTAFSLASLAAFPAILLAQPALVNSMLSVEVTGDGSFPTSKLGGAELKAGYGGGANVQLRLQPHVQVYGGWEWHQFATDQFVLAQTTDITEVGYAVGMRLARQFASEYRSLQDVRSSLGYWIRGGGIVSKLELQNDNGVTIGDTKYGVGWEAGAGITIPFGERLSLNPGARFRSLSRDLTIGPLTRAVTLNYVTATIGFSVAF